MASICCSTGGGPAANDDDTMTRRVRAIESLLVEMHVVRLDWRELLAA